MTTSLLRLYPGPPGDVPLAGALLADRVHELGSPAAPFVYGSFVSSLDGRIAVSDPDSGETRLPPGLSNPADFRLLLELQAQADCLITNAGYLRDLAAGRLDDVLQIGTRAEGSDLAAWRLAEGLAPQPAVVVVSASLDFVLPESLAGSGQRVMVAVGRDAPAGPVERLRRAGMEVIVAGDGTAVGGPALVRALGDRGFSSLYLLAGPRMLETMLRGGVLARLYVTLAHRLFGGAHFQSMIQGPELGEAGRLRLTSLLHDADGGQWFARFEPERGVTAEGAEPPPGFASSR